MLKRDKDIQDFLNYCHKKSYGKTQREAEKKSECLFCGEKIGEFKAEINKKEYEISGMCQKCQDDFFNPDNEM